MRDTINSLDIQLLREIEQFSEDKQEKITASLTRGIPADFADYRFRCGQFKAYGDVVAWAKQTNRRLLGLPEKEEG